MKKTVTNSKKALNENTRNVAEKCEEKTPMQIWGEREVEIACDHELDLCKDKHKDDAEYGINCYKSALKAYKSLLEDGHSGYSIGYTINILNRLVNCQVLTPIYENEENLWTKVWSNKKEIMYQCNRMSSFFKTEHLNAKNKVISVSYRDINRVTCMENTGRTYHSEWICDIVNKLYPIEMPYMPSDDTFVAIIEKFKMSNRLNIEYDTFCITGIQLPNKKLIVPELYFRVSGEDKKIRISKEEYEERKRKYMKTRPVLC